jgi:hypothetical protein
MLLVLKLKYVGAWMQSHMINERYNIILNDSKES